MTILGWARGVAQYMKDTGCSDGDVHVFPLSEEKNHSRSGACWCEPSVDYIDPETGVMVYLHRMIQ